MKTLFTEEEFEKSKSEDKLPCECYHCGGTFLTMKKIIKFEKERPKRNRVKFCSQQCKNLFNTPPVIIKCANCDKEVKKTQSEVNSTKHSFCSMSCAGTYNGKLRVHSVETKQKISKSNKKKFKGIRNIDVVKICKQCSSEFHTRVKKGIFCSRSCQTTWANLNLGMARKAGLASVSAQSETRRSKNEIYFGELCANHFKEVKFNEPMFNGWDADVIIEDIKMAVLWNGKWHYEKITKKHSVAQVQNRDKIKQREITEKGYQSYVIKDMGKYNRLFVENKFAEFLVYLKLIS